GRKTTFVAAAAGLARRFVRLRHVHHGFRGEKLQAEAAGQGRLPLGSLRRIFSSSSKRKQTKRVFVFFTGECTLFKEKFMKCLQANHFENGLCRQESKEYLECRMERELMAKEPLEKLGFKDLKEEKAEDQPETVQQKNPS
ncbi:hypothetical protein Chor_015272, partial [Crotalus horridus]